MQEWTKYTVSVRTTWHPVGRSYWYGPVRNEQRVNGQNTGLCFIVSRRRYWLISALAWTSSVPMLRRIASRWLRTMTVEYRWVWYGKRGQP